MNLPQTPRRRSILAISLAFCLLDKTKISVFSRQNLLIKPYVKGFEMNSMELMYLKKVRLTGSGK
ncbi:MAG TPA: hypothetical protein EYO37_06510 [Nitrospina sp.]|nr:hypothetical protein [Nitrospina sp.]